MPFRFIHTADWQIGKVFRFVDDQTMGVLQQARLEAISRIGRLAEEHAAGHVLVAGDVWDHEVPTLRTRNQTLERMRGHSDVQWHLLPGNHDPHQPNGLWDQLRQRGLPDNVHVYTEPFVSDIEPGVAALLPAPLQHRRSLSDLTEWMDNAQDLAQDNAQTDDGVIRIGLAHGSVRGFGSNEEQRANPIDPTRPVSARLDYLALGDWHGPLTVNDRCRYSGTPETDSFQTQGTGTALLVEVDAPGATPRVTQLDTGQYVWVSTSERVSNQQDVDRLDDLLRSLGREPAQTMVSLTVEGALSLSDMEYFGRKIGEEASASLAHLRVHDDDLYAIPNDDDMDMIDAGGIVRAAADRLREMMDDGGEPGELASEALQRLFIEQQRIESQPR